MLTWKAKLKALFLEILFVLLPLVFVAFGWLSLSHVMKSSDPSSWRKTYAEIVRSQAELVSSKPGSNTGDPIVGLQATGEYEFNTDFKKYRGAFYSSAVPGGIDFSYRCKDQFCGSFLNDQFGQGKSILVFFDSNNPAQNVPFQPPVLTKDWGYMAFAFLNFALALAMYVGIFLTSWERRSLKSTAKIAKEDDKTFGGGPLSEQIADPLENVRTYINNSTPNSLNTTNYLLDEGLPFLLELVRLDRWDLVELAIRKGADPNFGLPSGRTLLHEVAHFGEECIDTIKILVQKGLDPNATDEAGRSPIFGVRNFSVFKTLIDLGADPTRKTFFGFDIIWVLCGRTWDEDQGRECIKILDYLFVHYFDFEKDFTNELRQSLLFQAIDSTGYLGASNNVVKYLINKEVDVHGTDFDGKTALHCAANAANLELCKYLIKKGLDPNKRIEESGYEGFLKGDTPLKLAQKNLAQKRSNEESSQEPTSMFEQAHEERETVLTKVVEYLDSLTEKQPNQKKWLMLGVRNDVNSTFVQIPLTSRKKEDLRDALKVVTKIVSDPDEQLYTYDLYLNPSGYFQFEFVISKSEKIGEKDFFDLLMQYVELRAEVEVFLKQICEFGRIYHRSDRDIFIGEYALRAFVETGDKSSLKWVKNYIKSRFLSAYLLDTFEKAKVLFQDDPLIEEIEETIREVFIEAGIRFP